VQKPDGISLIIASSSPFSLRRTDTQERGFFLRVCRIAAHATNLPRAAAEPHERVICRQPFTPIRFKGSISVAFFFPPICATARHPISTAFETYGGVSRTICRIQSPNPTHRSLWRAQDTLSSFSSLDRAEAALAKAPHLPRRLHQDHNLSTHHPFFRDLP